MRVIAPIPKQFVDSNGVPYANGKVTVYLHGSTYLAQIYQEAEGNALAPNPTILDSHGSWNAFVTPDTSYDYIVQDEHDNVIFPYTNVSVSGTGAVSESIYELAMFDLSQAGHNLYGDIDSDLGKGLLPIIAAGSQGAVRYYYYTARDSQAHTMTFTCGYNGSVELLVLKNDDTYEFVPTALDARLPIVIDDGVITNNGTGLTVFGANSWSEGAGVDENYVAVVVGNVLIDNFIELDYAGMIRAGDKLRISDKTLNVVSVNYTSNTITVAPGLNVSGGEEVYICGGSLGKASHTEGCATETTGKYSHAEGYRSKSFGDYSHAEGCDTRAYSDGAHAEGEAVVAQGSYSHAEGYGSTDYMEVALDCTESTVVEVSYIGSDVAIGVRVDTGNDIYSIVAIDADTSSITLSSPVTLRTGDRLYVMTGAFGSYSHAEGIKTISSGTGSHSEGNNTIASELGAHAEGDRCKASGINAHAEGHLSVASNYSSHAEGESVSSGYYSHSEGCSSASGQCSHAEGDDCIAYGQDSHAEGSDTSAIGYSAHSEGYSTFAFGYACHAEGRGSVLGTGNTVLDNGSYERSIVHLDSVYGISPGDYVCFDYDHDSSSNEWIKVINVDDQTNEIELNNTTTAPYGVETYIAKGVASDDGAHSEGVNCSAIGYGAHCGGEDSTARGYCAFAHGSMCNVDADYGIAIGKYSTVKAESGIAIGSTCAVSAVDSVAVGYSASSRSAYSLAIGANAQSFGGSSCAVGYYALAYGNLSLAANTGKAFGAHSVCIGDSGSYVSSTWAVADNHGDNVITVDDASGILVGDIIEINDGITATVTVITGNLITIDKNVDVYEYDDVYIYKTGSIGEYSVHVGSDCSAVGDYSVCVGKGLAMRKDYGVSFGKYNVDDNAIFVVGNGTDENSRADCFKIDANGKLMFMHNGNLTDLSTLLNTHNIT